MKNPDKKAVSRLEDLPNIGKSIAADLKLIGVDHPGKLAGKNPFELYEALCVRVGNRVDPCVIDVFMAAICFVQGGIPHYCKSFSPVEGWGIFMPECA